MPTVAGRPGWVPPPSTTVPAPSWAAGTVHLPADIVTTSRGDRVRCVTAHNAATSFTDDLPYWESVDAPIEEPIMLQLARHSKGGSIGIGDMGAVAFRFDDGHETFHSTVYPLLTARGVPAAHACISDFTAQPWSDGDSAANVLTRNKNGVEVWSHGIDHKDPSPHGLTGAGGLVDQIVGSKTTIEGWGVKVQGWMQPGATPLGAAEPYGTDFTAEGDIYTYAALLIRQTYPLSEMDTTGKYRAIPAGVYHGANHITISDGMTYAAAADAVDRAVRGKFGLVMMIHCHNLGSGANLSVAEFTTLLDYVIAYWDAGDLEILTPSGLMFADHGSSRVDLLAGSGTFDDAARWNLSTGRTIETGGGHTGANYHSTTSSTTSLSTINPRFDNLTQRGFSGETFLFEGWARSNGAGTTVSRVVLQDYDDSGNLNLSLTRSGITTTWTRVRHAFTIPPVTDEVNMSIGRNSGDGIDWDDITVRKV